MSLVHLPLLDIQRELHTMQRGMRRFRKYLEVMAGDTDDIAVPLVGMNPMARVHQTEMLEALHAMGAEQVVAATIAEAVGRLPPLRQRVEVGILAVDDARGGWTNRYFSEMGAFQQEPVLRRGWSLVPIWTSESWSPERLRVETLRTIYRSAWVLAFGDARALGAMLEQEGMAARFAAAPYLPLDAEDVAYTREVLAPLLGSTVYHVQLAALFGDEAARSVGFPPIGLSARAGFAAARARADESPLTPEAALRERRAGPQ